MVDSIHTCLAVINLDSAFKKDDINYPQVFLKKCQYIEKNLMYFLWSNFENIWWMLEEPVNNKDSPSIQFPLRKFYQE